MNKPLDFPLLTNRPFEIPLTVSQYNNLSINGLANFMVHWPVVIADHESYLIIYCEKWRGYYFGSKTFAEAIPGKIYEDAKIASFKIQKSTKLYDIVRKHENLFLKKDDIEIDK